MALTNPPTFVIIEVPVLPLSPNRYKLRNLFFIAFIYIVASTVPPV
jgi:hypothetical protein